MDSNSNGVVVPIRRKLTEFQCVHCNKSFGANYTLRQHTKQFHIGEELPVVRMGRRPKAATSSGHPLKPDRSCGSRITNFQCALCHKYFAASNTLKRHMSRIHVNRDLNGVEKKDCKIPSEANSSSNLSIYRIRRSNNVVMEFDSVAGKYNLTFNFEQVFD